MGDDDLALLLDVHAAPPAVGCPTGRGKASRATFDRIGGSETALVEPSRYLQEAIVEGLGVHALGRETIKETVIRIDRFRIADCGLRIGRIRNPRSEIRNARTLAVRGRLHNHSVQRLD